MITPRILVIEDSASMAAVYTGYLQHAGFAVEYVTEACAGLERLSQTSFQAVVLDLHLPDIDGMEVLGTLRQSYEDMPVIIITAYGSVDKAVEAMKIGAFDFIAKPFPEGRLITTVERALDHFKIQCELKELRREVRQEQFQEDFIGNSPAMQAVFRQIDAVAPSRVSIFISGERGTGKKLTARAIHRKSPRAPLPFIALACDSRESMETELFGTPTQPGVLQQVKGGTLFLDEVCELPVELQKKLVRFLQTGAFSPVGSRDILKADVRIISATSRDPQQELAEGLLYEDLFHRLFVIPLELPPLRERENDALLIAQHYLKIYSMQEKRDFVTIDAEALSLFMQYEWPGNVRELETLIHQTVTLYEGSTLTAEMLPEEIRQFLPTSPVPQGFVPFLVKPLWQVEKDTILRAMEASRNDVPRAAAILQVSPATLHRKLKAWELKSDSRAPLAV